MSERDYFISFAQQLGELNGNISAVLQRLEKGDAKMADHEARLAMLERGKHQHEIGKLPQWAVYLIVALVSILAGVLGVKVPSYF